MEIKSAIRRILNSTAESIYLLKYKKNIKSGTVYSDNDRINIPCRLKRIRSYANAQYIVSDGSLPDRFIKKRGQIIILICEFSPDVFFGRYQRLLSYADYLPDIQRRGKAENKAGKQNARRAKLKLSVLPIFKIRSSYLYKEQNGKYHIAHRKNYIINDSLNLTFRCVPCILNSSRHIARRKYGYRKHGQDRRH